MGKLQGDISRDAPGLSCLLSALKNDDVIMDDGVDEETKLWASAHVALMLEHALFVDLKKIDRARLALEMQKSRVGHIVELLGNLPHECVVYVFHFAEPLEQAPIFALFVSRTSPTSAFALFARNGGGRLFRLIPYNIEVDADDLTVKTMPRDVPLSEADEMKHRNEAFTGGKFLLNCLDGYGGQRMPIFLKVPQYIR